MAGSTCKRRMTIVNLGSAVAPGVELHIPQACAEFFVGVVNSTGTPIAFTLADKENPGQVLHFAAGATFTDDDLALSGPIVLLIASAAGGTVEAQLWEG